MNPQLPVPVRALGLRNLTLPAAMFPEVTLAAAVRKPLRFICQPFVVSHPPGCGSAVKLSSRLEGLELPVIAACFVLATKASSSSFVNGRTCEPPERPDRDAPWTRSH